MGSFASTCVISGIPLEAGDPVRWYSLTENPYDDNLVCYSHDMWFPRSWPVRAKYNDYGSIEEYDVKSPSVFATVECLKRDLVEVGMGDNQCHDVPTAKGMSFEATLEAIWEKRIQVSRDVEDSVLVKIRASSKAARAALNMPPDEEDEPKPRTIPGFPTLRGVEAILRQAGFPVLTAEGKEPEAYMVDQVEYGRCRVRVNGYGDDHADKLQAILPILAQEYAAVITVGSRAYANSAEIQLMPKVMKRERDEFFSWGRDDTERRKPLYVYQAMIHGDVWDELMKMKVSKDWAEKVKVGFDEYRADAQKLWDKACKPRKKSDRPIDDLIARLDNDHDTYVGALVAKSVIPFTISLSDHWRAVVDRHQDKKFTAKQVDEFLDDVAGFSLLHGILPMVRYWWRPSFTCGPQFGEHKKHADVFAAFRRATMAAKKRRAW